MKGIEVSYKTLDGPSNFVSHYIEISMHLSPLLFELITGNNKDITEIEFGERPNIYEELDPNLQQELEKIYVSYLLHPLKKDKNLRKTERSFVIEENKTKEKEVLNSGFGSFYNRSTKHIKKEYQEYEYQGKKYVRTKKNDKVCWVEVTPVKWKVNHHDKTLTTSDPIAVDILYEEKYDASHYADGLSTLKTLRESKEETQRVANDIVFKSILETVKLKKIIKYKDYKELLQIISNNNGFEDYDGLVEIILEGPPLDKEEKENINKMLGNNKYTYIEEIFESRQNVEIKKIVSKIYSLLDLGIFDNKEEIKNRINKLIKNYNYKIRNQSEDLLSLERQDKSYLYSTLLGDLTRILDELMVTCNNNKEHVEMLQLTNNCINIIQGNEDTVAIDDLEKFILTIKTKLLPSIQNTNKEQELLELFETEKQSLISYIKGNSNSKAKDFNSLNDYKNHIRSKIQTFLIKVNIEIRSQDVVKDILEMYKNIIKDEKADNEDKHINYFLEEIQKSITFIKENGTKEENEELMQLLNSVKIDKDTSFKDTTIQLTTLLKNIYVIVIGIENRTKANQEIDDYTINL